MELYPEKRPVDSKPLQKFTFNAAAIEHSASDIELQYEAWETKISRLIDKYQITCNGHQFPIIEKILELTHDEEELVGVGRALERVAHHIQELDELKKKRDVIQYAQTNSDWMAWAFGDFDVEIMDLEAELNALSITDTED